MFWLMSCVAVATRIQMLRFRAVCSVRGTARMEFHCVGEQSYSMERSLRASLWACYVNHCELGGVLSSRRDPLLSLGQSCVPYSWNLSSLNKHNPSTS